MPLFKNDEDEEFVKILFRKAILHSKNAPNLLIKIQLTGKSTG